MELAWLLCPFCALQKGLTKKHHVSEHDSTTLTRHTKVEWHQSKPMHCTTGQIIAEMPKQSTSASGNGNAKELSRAKMATKKCSSCKFWNLSS